MPAAIGPLWARMDERNMETPHPGPLRGAGERQRRLAVDAVIDRIGDCLAGMGDTGAMHHRVNVLQRAGQIARVGNVADHGALDSAGSSAGLRSATRTLRPRAVSQGVRKVPTKPVAPVMRMRRPPSPSCRDPCALRVEMADQQQRQRQPEAEAGELGKGLPLLVAV